ncbi:MAG: DUF4236 domain-containing protein [[Eubacterium] siraeum]|nr:DUF4236 domain-containing protein [[Eubacterium] siraeum]
MGLKFRKSINLGNGFKANVSKSGVGFSWGVKGFRITKSANGKVKSTVSLPGTGLSYTQEIPIPGKEKTAAKKTTKTASKTAKSSKK